MQVLDKKMSWSQINIEEEDRSRLERQYPQRARFLLDENLSNNSVTSYLKKRKINVKTCNEFGLIGRTDLELFECARREKKYYSHAIKTF